MGGTRKTDTGGSLDIRKNSWRDRKYSYSKRLDEDLLYLCDGDVQKANEFKRKGTLGDYCRAIEHKLKQK